jgi:hypothetical protein
MKGNKLFKSELKEAVYPETRQGMRDFISNNY